jgi:hypothetical protein
MKQFIKDGEIKSLKRIIVIKDDMQFLSPTEEMVLEDGWVEYVIPEPTEEKLLNKAKEDIIREIGYYDSSLAVNSFYIGDVEMWLDKATRAGLKLRFEAEIAMGHKTTTLWYGSYQYPLMLSQAIQMLYAIEIYASMCYDNTQAHIAKVNMFDSIDEVKAYNYMTGYPEKLRF